MSILSVLAFTAIKASRHGHAMALVGEHPGAFRGTHARFELIKVVVASKDVLQARKALLACADTAIVRCLPRHKDDRVELEIRFPAGQGDAVIDQVLACLPHGGIAACATPRPKPRTGHSSVVQLQRIY